MNTAIINLADEGMIYENIQVHYEIFIFLLSKMFKTMNIHLNVTQLSLSVSQCVETMNRSAYSRSMSIFKVMGFTPFNVTKLHCLSNLAIKYV